MDMNTINKDNVPDSDTGNRHAGDIVPVIRGSSTCKGLTSELVASSEAKAVIASVEKLQTEYTVRKAPPRAYGGDSPGSFSEEVEMLGASSFCGVVLSDSDDPGPSGSSEICRLGFTKSKKRKKKNSPPDEEIEEKRFGTRFSINNKKRVEDEVAGLELEHASKINLKIRDMVDEIENIKRKSSNLKGSFSGQMKVFLEVIRRASSLLSIKATSNEDPDFWKAKYYSMEKESNENRCRIDALEARLREYGKKEFLKNAYENNTSEKEYVDRATSAPSASESEDRMGKVKKESWYRGKVNIDRFPVVSESMVSGSMERINLDRAILHSLDRLVEGMTQLTRKTRQSREAMDFTIRGTNSAGKTKKAREKISLAELEIVDTRIKRAANGGVLIEIPGAESETKADKLCSRLRELFFDIKGVSLRRPMKRVQLRLSGLDDSISIQEIKNTIAKEGSCDILNVTCGTIRHVRGGLGVAFVQCPVAAAVRILERGRLVIGWSTIGVEALKARPLQCFRCLAVGHTVQRCPSTEVRRFNCYRCGQVDHKAAECKNKVTCPVCAERGLKADHLVGSVSCKPVPPIRIASASNNKNVNVKNSNKENAQDNLTHLMEEKNAALAVISEPNSVPEDDRWVTESNFPPKAAILWRKVSGRFSPMIKLHQAEYEKFPILLLGVFNARHLDWDKKRGNSKGNLLKHWLDNLDLIVMNKFIATCIRPRGESVIDLVICNRNAEKIISSCMVDTEAVTVSDHRLVIIQMDSKLAREKSRVIGRNFPKWNARKVDIDAFKSASIVSSWGYEENDFDSAEEIARWINATLKNICNHSMPRNSGKNKSLAYWWNDDLAVLRRIVTDTRRSLSRARRRRCNEVINQRYREYRSSLLNYRRGIKSAKLKAWNDLIKDLDEDPWGLPYKIVLKKMRPVSLPVCETLSYNDTMRIVRTLFPRREDTIDNYLGSIDWNEDLVVSEIELKEAMKKSSRGKKAPGPDGIPGVALSGSLGDLMGAWLSCFNRCFRESIFPREWKRAGLVLLRKREGQLTDPRIYRPICFLDESAKLFERVIVSRIHDHLESTASLSDNQYGFRRGRSTLDAILKLREIVRGELDMGKLVLGVSFDIENAFNSIPWGVVRGAIATLGFPGYLYKIICAYLSDRSLSFTDSDGVIRVSRMSCGVPQGSVLGPTLWNIVYNGIFDLPLPEGCWTLGYADDTILLVSGVDLNETRDRAMLAAGLVVREIEIRSQNISSQN
ncbi:uncharacterized protein [Linepithema humile]|uniref:uncharacterized protein n=1 Tax=Linepithema humile TaxID=83485 RepID=UPI00351E6FA5